MNDIKNLKTIQLRKLQSLLSRTFGDEIIVINYTTKNLIKPGDNFANTLFDVHAVIKRDCKAEEENIQLVAKMPAQTAEQQKVLDSPTAFKKEIFMYEHIIVHYNEIERKAGFEERELFKILPAYHGSRLSLDPTINFDDDAVILMENLKIRGYYICDKVRGCDLEHSRIAIQALAKFHALGMVSKYKRPEYFEVLKQRSKCLEFEFDNDSIYNHVLGMIAKDPQIAVYINRCEAAKSYSLKYGQWTVTPVMPDELWSTIIHADFWVNNIMFHRDENGRVDNIKFVDFQNYLFLSPLREMVFYLFCSTAVIDDDIEELIDLYHEAFLAILNRMDCDTKPFNREEFDKRLDIDAKCEFLHVAVMIPIIIKDDQEICIERLRKFILYFVRRNWI